MKLIPKKTTCYKRPKETAEHFCIGLSTLWLWTKTRLDFPQPIKMGARVTLFDINAIEAWLQSQNN